MVYVLFIRAQTNKTPDTFLLTGNFVRNSSNPNKYWLLPPSTNDRNLKRQVRTLLDSLLKNRYIRDSPLKDFDYIKDYSWNGRIEKTSLRTGKPSLDQEADHYVVDIYYYIRDKKESGIKNAVGAKCNYHEAQLRRLVKQDSVLMNMMNYVRDMRDKRKRGEVLQTDIERTGRFTESDLRRFIPNPATPRTFLPATPRYGYSGSYMYPRAPNVTPAYMGSQMTPTAPPAGQMFRGTNTSGTPEPNPVPQSGGRKKSVRNRSGNGNKSMKRRGRYTKKGTRRRRK